MHSVHDILVTVATMSFSVLQEPSNQTCILPCPSTRHLRCNSTDMCCSNSAPPLVEPIAELKGSRSGEEEDRVVQHL